MYGQFGEAGVGLAAISADEITDSEEFASDSDIRIPLLADPKLETIESYGVRQAGNDISIPAVFIIDEEGLVRWRYVGETMMDRPDAKTILAKAIAIADGSR
jgi:peroxiredoxin